ncbi:hypothetical protein [Corallococcus sp. EGB]|uniref:hypothetical protein n=1 Tax=Corallococcus sp. EGB TaxID=1521117 RepID=UPI001CBC9FD4|nr:hypothetical protein [Corallococcus sp. EGB]
MTLPRPGRRVRYLLPVALLALVLWFTWTQLTRRRGDTRASFTPASQQCDVQGPLRYCVNKAAGGTNGDIVYHHHGRKYVADEAEWRRVSPLQLAAQAGPDAPELYLSCGLYDAYGNYEGTERLAHLARQRGVRTEWHPLYGGHCATDVSSLADFLVR